MTKKDEDLDSKIAHNAIHRPLEMSLGQMAYLDTLLTKRRKELELPISFNDVQMTDQQRTEHEHITRLLRKLSDAFEKGPDAIE